jgi:hypothetical protein
LLGFLQLYRLEIKMLGAGSALYKQRQWSELGIAHWIKVLVSCTLSCLYGAEPTKVPPHQRGHDVLQLNLFYRILF